MKKGIWITLLTATLTLGVAVPSVAEAASGPQNTPLMPYTIPSFNPTPVFYIETSNKNFQKVFKTAFNKWNTKFKQNKMAARFRYRVASSNDPSRAQHDFTVSDLNAGHDTKAIEWNVSGAVLRSKIGPDINGLAANTAHVWLNSGRVGISPKMNFEWRAVRGTLVAEHELGHVLGLAHNLSGAETVMTPIDVAYSRTSKKGVIREIQQSDVDDTIQKVGKYYVQSYGQKGPVYYLKLSKTKTVLVKRGGQTYRQPVVTKKYKLYPAQISKYDLASVNQNILNFNNHQTSGVVTNDMGQTAQQQIVFDYAKRYPKTQLSKHSKEIVAGTVMSSTSSRSKSFPITVHQLKIDKKYKNKLKVKGNTLTFNQMGNDKISVADSLLLKPGTKVLLYLRRGEHGTFNLINEGNSIFLKADHSNQYTNVANQKQYTWSNLIN